MWRSGLMAFVLLALAASGRAQPLFELVPPAESGVDVENRLVETADRNVLAYEYFYNGGGVAAGDLDGDGLADLYFTVNMGPNRLYLNRTAPGGPLRFEDVTASAGVAGPDNGWTTGVTMADVDGDGHLDLYVSRSGDGPASERRNLLYLNDGAARFREAAAEVGLDDAGHATQATFADIDRDGDLDMYLVNHNVKRLRGFDVQVMKTLRDSLAGDRLYRNDGGRFTDVTEAAGIHQTPIGFGLSATVGDMDGDGWPDIYVANDYDEDDYLYLNNRDGTFRDATRERLAHTSFFSMGSDLADVDNDGRPDLITLDMLPPDNRRQKLLKGPENYDRQRLLLSYGYGPQYMRNMLHRNAGDAGFQEVGQLAGVSNTDWSWSALLEDFDNDGWRDLYVTNGYVRDYTNMDFLKFVAPEARRAAQARGEEPDLLALVRQMPSSDLSNMAFRNLGGLRFEEATAPWGMERPSLSAGAATADLDGDGDLDLVVSNINGPAFVYRNRVDERGDGQSVRIRLAGEGGNRFGVGAHVEAAAIDGRRWTAELQPSRGYQSSVEPVVHLGIGDAEQVDVTVTWPDGRQQSVADVAAGTLTLRQADAAEPEPRPEDDPAPRFARLAGALGIDHVHRENPFVDFRREPLLPHLLSRYGPALATGDVNGDGLDDVFAGGARNQPAALFLQTPAGRFARAEAPALAADSLHEDTDAVLFDADGDGDLDLYVVSGGSESADAADYQDRLYRNSGFGAFERATDVLPSITASGATVAPADWDGDGDLDLFVGGRVVPGRYPLAPRSYLLRNDGGTFRDVTPEIAPDAMEPGMVAASLWADLDGDGPPELVVAGEWMPVRVFRQRDGRFEEITETLGLGDTHGWWSALAAADLDGDGDLDLVGGNRGLNAQVGASPAEPATLLAADIDGNGSIDPVLSYYIDGVSVPAVSRDEMLGQVAALRRQFTDYASYADATVEDIVPAERRTGALRLRATTFASAVFVNEGGQFASRPLPVEAQVAPVHAIALSDLDRDGITDILLAGNEFGMRAQDGPFDAGRGLWLRGGADLALDPVDPAESGFVVPGDVRALRLVRTSRGSVVVVGTSNEAIEVYAIL
ncbi:MAG: CRTAC1 family protein [Bacteroidota bacterium]